MTSVNKILITVLLLAVVSCTKYERKRRPNMNPEGFSIEVQVSDKTSTGQITEREASVAMIHVWKSDNRNFAILSVGQAVDGYATDLISDRLESAYYTALTSPASDRATVGKYFVFVMLDESPANGKFAYSYTSFEVKEGEQTQLKKTFTSHVGDTQFEDWNAAE